MQTLTIDGCPAWLVHENVAVILDLEAECVVLTRIDADLKVGGHFEIPINLRTFNRMQAAKNEMELLIAALAV